MLIADCMRENRTLLLIMSIGVLLMAARLVVPEWVSLMIVTVLAKALVVLGVVLLLRGGLVSFGQGLYYCLGGYAVGLGSRWFGISDIFLLLALAVVVALLVGGALGFLLSRYREIFFAMLSLALSMILYGLLTSNEALGSDDGFPVRNLSLFGEALTPHQIEATVYLLTCGIATLVACLAHLYMRAPMGFAGSAVHQNEVRVEYLGLSPRTVSYSNYVVASVLGALGGALIAMDNGHVSPNMAFWAQSGEFVFIALMGGINHVGAVFIGATVFEIVRTFALEFAPQAWRIILGSVLVLIICFLPFGLWSLPEKIRGIKAARSQKEAT